MSNRYVPTPTRRKVSDVCKTGSGSIYPIHFNAYRQVNKIAILYDNIEGKEEK